MSSPINTSSKSINTNLIPQDIVDKTKTLVDPNSIMAQANKAFAEVAVKYASDGGGKQEASSHQTDPNAPDLKKPDPGAIKDALKEVEARSKGTTNDTAPPREQSQAQNNKMQPRSELKRNELSKSDASRTDAKDNSTTGADGRAQNQDGKAQKQQKTAATMTKDSPLTDSDGSGDRATNRTTGDSSRANRAPDTKGAADNNIKEAAANADNNANRAADANSTKNSTVASKHGDDSGHTDHADAADGDTNRETKFVSKESKDVKNQNRSDRPQRGPQQVKTALQNTVAAETNSVADTQLAANAVQANSDVDDDDVATGKPPLTNAAAMGLLLGEVMKLLDSNSVKEMLANMEKLGIANQAAIDDFKAQADALEQMQAQNTQLNGQLDGANQTLDQLKAASDAAAAAAKAAKPPSKDLQDKADAAAAAVTKQQAVVAGLKGQITNNLAKITDANTKFHDDLSAYNASHMNPTTAQMQQDTLTTAAKMALVMAQFMNIIDQNNIDQLNASLKKNQELVKAQAADQAKQAEKAIENQKKSEAMGCIMKLIAAIVTAVSVIAAVFTGGASLVFAAASLALMATDKILEATGHATITGTIMDKVIKPIMDAIAKAISGVLKGIFGDQPWVNTVSTALAAIVTALAIIALVVVGMKAAGSQIAKVAGEAVSKTVKEAMPQVIKSMGNAAEKSVGKLLNPMMNTLSKLTKVSDTTLNTIDTTAKVTQAAGAVGGAGVSTAGAVYTEKLNHTLADMQFATAMKAQFGNMLTDDQMNLFKAIQEFIARFQETMSGVISSENQAAKGILGNMRGIAS